MHCDSGVTVNAILYLVYFVGALQFDRRCFSEKSCGDQLADKDAEDDD